MHTHTMHANAKEEYVMYVMVIISLKHLVLILVISHILTFTRLHVTRISSMIAVANTSFT